MQMYLAAMEKHMALNFTFQDRICDGGEAGSQDGTSKLPNDQQQVFGKWYLLSKMLQPSTKMTVPESVHIAQSVHIAHGNS